MGVTVVVPFRPDPHREAAWRYVRDCYPRQWEVTAADCAGPWAKGRAVANALEAATGDVLVIADADLIVRPDDLRAAVVALERAAWVIPHRYVFRLNERATARVLAGGLDPFAPLPRWSLARAPRVGPPGGGFVVVRRADFERAGGIDPRFVGWGGEDISLARALDTLAGAHVRLEADAFHLWHKPMVREPGNRASPASERLAALYLEADGKPDAMRAVIG